MSEAPAMPALRARGLVYATGGRRLVDGVDLDIAAGQCTVILGPNGAGKSLLLRLLHGLIRPSAGRVTRAGGREAMVFQRPVMLRRSVRSNLRFALGVAGFTGAARRARIDEGLQLAGLAALARRPARLLSGGEQQRLAMARALVTDPAVLFLDEPSASLDPAATLAVESLVRAARARGVTVVLVTHDAGQARRLGDRAVFLQAGRVAEAGPAAELLNAPRSAPAQAWLDGRLYVPRDTEYRDGRKD
ncbi:ATP-binding cassette domain-containing protein [Pseudoponticoccus marisrubri]|uniref:ABC transporter ATP-binding protein n=1 Tax=Pseudoponticoccus marisrubri TaxID=1685382 RepID=A0A0W7WL24_9RHOB|nr:ATP-binding cassette domain-containing protein [Pseudoponticoccus marisrubri]KUF11273.1 ABC transporter ATP-binding protein [Pseudoponticoccus marisrubri]